PHHVRGGEQQLGQQQPSLRAAAETDDRPLVVDRAETEPLQHLLDLVVDRVGVFVVQQLGQPVEAGGERLVLGLVGRGGQPLGRLDEVVLGGEQVVQGGLGFVE